MVHYVNKGELFLVTESCLASKNLLTIDPSYEIKSSVYSCQLRRLSISRVNYGSVLDTGFG